MDLNSKPKAASSRPFYKPPENKAISSQIISEARSSLRSFGTKRPFTPRDEQRHLFPSSTNRAPESRPPSSFSLGSRHFDGPDSRPVSGTRLSPLDHSFAQAPRTPTAADLENILPPKPPASDPSRSQSRRSANTRHRIHTQQSADGFVSKEVGAAPHRSESLTDDRYFISVSSSDNKSHRDHAKNDYSDDSDPDPAQMENNLPNRQTSTSANKERLLSYMNPDLGPTDMPQEFTPSCVIGVQLLDEVKT